MIQIATALPAISAGPARPVLLAAQSGASNFALALGSLLVPGAAPKAAPDDTPVAEAALPGRQIVAEPGKELPEIRLDLADDEDAPEQKSQADQDAPEGDDLAFAWFATPAAAPVADTVPVAAAPIAAAPIVAGKVAADKQPLEIQLPDNAAPEGKPAAAPQPGTVDAAAPPAIKSEAEPAVGDAKPRLAQRLSRQAPTAPRAVSRVDTPPVATAAPEGAEAKPVTVPGTAPVAAETTATRAASRPARAAAAAAPVAEAQPAAGAATAAATIAPEAPEDATAPTAAAPPVRQHRSARFSVPVEAPVVTVQPSAQPAVENVSAPAVLAEAPVVMAQPVPKPGTEAPVAEAQPARQPDIANALAIAPKTPAAAAAAAAVAPTLAPVVAAPTLTPAAQPVIETTRTAPAEAPTIIAQPTSQPAVMSAETPVNAPQFLRQPAADAAPVVRVEAPAVRSDAPVTRTDAPAAPQPPARQPGLDAAQPATVASLIAQLPSQTIAAQPFAFTSLRRTLHETDQPLMTNAAAPGAAILQQVTAASDTQQGTLDMRRQEWTGKMVEMIEAMREAAPVKETRISLMPDALGKVDISVRQDGDRVHVHFAAETQAARQILTDAQPRLAELAEARGVRLGQTSVDSQGSANTQSGQRQHDAQRPQYPSAPASARAGKDQLTQTDDRVA